MRWRNPGTKCVRTKFCRRSATAESIAADGEYGGCILRTLVELQREHNCRLDLANNADRIENNFMLNVSQGPLMLGMNMFLRCGVQVAPVMPVSHIMMQRAHDVAISDFLYSFANKLEWANRLAN